MAFNAPTPFLAYLILGLLSHYAIASEFNNPLHLASPLSVGVVATTSVYTSDFVPGTNFTEGCDVWRGKLVVASCSPTFRDDLGFDAVKPGFGASDHHAVTPAGIVAPVDDVLSSKVGAALLLDGKNCSGAAPFSIAASMYADTHGSGVASFCSIGYDAVAQYAYNADDLLSAKVGAALLTSLATFRVRSPHFGFVVFFATLIPVAAARDDFPLPAPPPPPPPVDNKPKYWWWFVAGGCVVAALALVATAITCYYCCKRGLQAANAAANTV